MGRCDEGGADSGSVADAPSPIPAPSPPVSAAAAGGPSSSASSPSHPTSPSASSVVATSSESSMLSPPLSPPPCPAAPPAAPPTAAPDTPLGVARNDAVSERVVVPSWLASAALPYPRGTAEAAIWLMDEEAFLPALRRGTFSSPADPPSLAAAAAAAAATPPSVAKPAASQSASKAARLARAAWLHSLSSSGEYATALEATSRTSVAKASASA